MNLYKNQLQEFNDLNNIQNDMGLAISSKELTSIDSVENEKILANLNNSIRQEWIKKISETTSKIYKSTLWGTTIQDVQNFNYHFSYETLLNDENEFADLMGYSINGMYNKTFLFSSGMNTITSLLFCLNSFFKDNLEIQASIGYYETKYFLKILTSMGIKVNLGWKLNSNSNVFLFEPIMYDASLSVTNIEKMILAINTSKAKLKILIMDSSMHNITNILGNIKNKISNINNIIFFDIRSGLKLDQEGLELTNLGICTSFVTMRNQKLFTMIKNYIEQYKGITGNNLSLDSLCLSHYFKTLKSKTYSRKVQDQVTWAWEKLNPLKSKVVKKIVWKKVDLYDEIFTVPFLFIELNSDSEKYYLNTIKQFQKAMLKKEVPIDYRNSWGFRFPSVEYFNDIFTGQKYIKFYPGSFKGLTAIEAVNYLREL